MAKEFRFELALKKPSRHAVFGVLSLFLLCLPVTAEDGIIGVSTVKTYYPIPYGGLDKPTVSEQFSFTPYTVIGTKGCRQAALMVSSPNFGVVSATGGVFAFAGHSLELAPGGTGGRVDIGSNSYLEDFLEWMPIASLSATYDTSATNPNPGGPYWTPICNGISTGSGAVCNFSTSANNSRLFIHANVLFGKEVAGCGLRLYTNSGMTLPSTVDSAGCSGYKP